MLKSNRAIVIGCGVNGLTCAVKLQELGLDVTIWTKDRVERTVSMVAASVWHPYLVFPRDRVAKWAIRSYEAFTALTQHDDAGVWIADGIAIPTSPVERPGWATEAMEIKVHERSADLPAHYSFRSPIIETPTYLPWLFERFIKGGGIAMEQTVSSFDEAFEQAPIVINCAGLGAGALTGDDRVRPIKGQIVRLAAGAFDRFLFDERDPMTPTYMIPRKDDCILGGTTEPGLDDSIANEEAQIEIIARCAMFEPRVLEAEILGSLAGVRPARDEVRLEAEIVKGKGLVVHNYGHGGAGITLSIGCADEVKSIVATATQMMHTEAINGG